VSDRSAGVENYDTRPLVGDVVAVIKHLGIGRSGSVHLRTDLSLRVPIQHTGLES
jgi:hypothetical protein